MTTEEKKSSIFSKRFSGISCLRRSVLKTHPIFFLQKKLQKGDDGKKIETGQKCMHLSV